MHPLSTYNTDQHERTASSASRLHTYSPPKSNRRRVSYDFSRTHGHTWAHMIPMYQQQERAPCNLSEHTLSHANTSRSASHSLSSVATTETSPTSNPHPTYDGVYHTHPRGGFPSLIARQPRGGQRRTMHLRKALGEMFPTPTFWHRHYYKACRYRAWKIGPGGCDT